MHLHAPDLKSVQFLSRQQQSVALSIPLASSPRKHEGEDSETLRSGPSRMSQVTKDMATRMLHMTQFLRKQGPITVWSVSPPLPQHFNRHKEKIFFPQECAQTQGQSCPVPAKTPALSHPS